MAVNTPRPFVFGETLSELEWRLGHAVPAIDVLTPNQFELKQLAGSTTPMLAAVRAAIDVLAARARSISW